MGEWMGRGMSRKICKWVDRYMIEDGRKEKKERKERKPGRIGLNAHLHLISSSPNPLVSFPLVDGLPGWTD